MKPCLLSYKFSKILSPQKFWNLVQNLSNLPWFIFSRSYVTLTKHNKSFKDQVRNFFLFPCIFPYPFFLCWQGLMPTLISAKSIRWIWLTCSIMHHHVNHLFLFPFFLSEQIRKMRKDLQSQPRIFFYEIFKTCQFSFPRHFKKKCAMIVIKY